LEAPEHFAQVARKKMTRFASFLDLDNHMVDYSKQAALQQEMKAAWEVLVPPSPQSPMTIHTAGSINDAIDLIAELGISGQRTHVLVTGSLHLVGGLFKVLDVALDW
jgi:hypothetical protein